MKRTILMLIAASTVFATRINAMNDSEARMILADKPFLPAAGELPQDYQRRVERFEARENLIHDLESSRKRLTSMTVTAGKLGLQIQTGMLIPDDKDKQPTPLTEEQKAAMLKELSELQEQIVRMQAQVRELAASLEEDDERIDREQRRRDIYDAEIRQTDELRREIRDEMDERNRR